MDLVRRYVDLKQVGSRWIAPCPFHQESKPSFSVDEEKCLFYCFGCQASGDLFDFYGRINGLDFRESLIQLAEELGISIDSKMPGIAAKNDKKQEKKKNRQELLRIHELACAHYKAELKSADSKSCQAYIEKRGLSPELVDKFSLGWASDSWQNLAEILRKSGFKKESILESGLVGQSKSGRFYDRFRARLIFPIKSLSNQVIAFGGRIIEQTEEAKYINSTDTPIYKKGEHLFGLAEARRAIVSQGTALLTEGYMDVLALHQFGYENAVGVLGTALTEEQIKRLFGFSSKIILLFDGDRAGRKAALRAAEMCLVRGMSSKVILLPEGEDIDSLLRNQGKAAFDHLFSIAKDGLEYCVNFMQNLSPRQSVEWARAFLGKIEIPELLSAYATALASRMHIAEAELRRNVKFGQENFVKTSSQKSAETAARDAQDTLQDMRERQILIFAVRYPKRLGDLCELGADLVLRSKEARDFWQLLQKWNPEETPRLFNKAQNAFWQSQHGPQAPPLGNGDMELILLRQHLESYYLLEQKAAVSTALRASTDADDFNSDLKYLRALQESLGKSDGKS